jgi:hypothetical protein
LKSMRFPICIQFCQPRYLALCIQDF